MKKLALTFAIVLGISLCSFAQGGLFQYGDVNQEEESYNIAWYSFYQDQEIDNGLFGIFRTAPDINTPDHGLEGNQPAPLGSGALLLIGFGAAYALKKKNKK